MGKNPRHNIVTAGAGFGIQPSVTRIQNPAPEPKYKFQVMKLIGPNFEHDGEYLYKALEKLKLLEHMRELRKDQMISAMPGLLGYIPQTGNQATQSYQRLQNQWHNYEQNASHLKHEVYQRIGLYAAPQCLEICGLTYDTLPRELRDMVYGYILGEPTTVDGAKLTTSSPKLSFPTEPGIKGHIPHGFRTQIHISYAHVFNHLFVGSEVRLELIELWYRATTFQFKNCRLIPIFLKHDHWSCGMDLHHCVKNIEVIRDLKDIGWPYAKRRPGFSLVEDIDFVFSFSERTMITFWIQSLGINRWNDWPSGTTMLNAKRAIHELSVMFPVAEQLLGMGYKISVKLDDQEAFEVTKDEVTEEHWVEHCRHLIEDSFIASE